MNKKKKTHGVQLLLRAVVRDPDGKIITDTGRKPAKSFVLQFLMFIGAMFDGLNTTAKAIDGGTTRSIYYGPRAINFPAFIIDAPINQDLYGIVVGTGDTAETNADYKLETQLTEGVGAGNITQGAMDVGTTGVVGANVDTEHKRAFTNNTGDLITVKEAGLYIITQDELAAEHVFCIIRDVLDAPGVEVPNRCSLTIYYTFRTTV